MHVCLLTGPHGTGKSTIARAVRTTLDPYVRMRTIFADDGDEWKRSPAEMQEMFAGVLSGPEQLLLVEGTHRITLTVIRAQLRVSQLSVHVISVTPPVMRTLLARRCGRIGKTFQAAYWSDHRCAVDNQYYRQLSTRFTVMPTVHEMDATYLAVPVVVNTMVTSVASALGLAVPAIMWPPMQQSLCW